MPCRDETNWNWYARGAFTSRTGTPVLVVFGPVPRVLLLKCSFESRSRAGTRRIEQHRRDLKNPPQSPGDATATNQGPQHNEVETTVRICANGSAARPRLGRPCPTDVADIRMLIRDTFSQTLGGYHSNNGGWVPLEEWSRVLTRVITPRIAVLTPKRAVGPSVVPTYRVYSNSRDRHVHRVACLARPTTRDEVDSTQ